MIRKGQRVKVVCSEARLKEVGVRQKHIKHILGKDRNGKGNTEAAKHGRYVRLLCTLPLCESESSTGKQEALLCYAGRYDRTY